MAVRYLDREAISVLAKAAISYDGIPVQLVPVVSFINTQSEKPYLTFWIRVNTKMDSISNYLIAQLSNDWFVSSGWLQQRAITNRSDP